MSVDISKEKLLWMYERMLLIREFEDRLHIDFAAGKIPGFVHLYAGQESVAVGVCANLTDEDYITSTHRGHGHCIAKDVDVNSMMAEIYGKATGTCKGKGGSMHIADVDKGMLGANGVVGGGPPIACGAALSSKLLRNKKVAVCFSGDGASNQGTTFESMNFAVVYDLPVIFLCENNGYAETTGAAFAVGGGDLTTRARGFGMHSVSIDGQDILEVYKVVEEAVERARTGQGPTFIEAKTYRYYGHFEGDAMKYREKEEVEAHRGNDCIVRFKSYLLENKLFTEEKLTSVEQKAKDAVEKAVVFASKSPYPAPEELLRDVYVNFPEANMYPFQAATA